MAGNSNTLFVGAQMVYVCCSVYLHDLETMGYVCGTGTFRFQAILHLNTV